MDYAGRLALLRGRMETEGLDAFFVTNLVNVRYLCGFTGSNAFLLVGHSGARFFSDGRYALQAAEQVAEADVIISQTHAELIEALNKRSSEGGHSKIGYQGADVTVKSRRGGWELPPGLDQLGAYFEGAELKAVGGWVEELRRVKEPAEVELVREAARMTDEGMSYILGKVEAGRTEREIALDLEFWLRSRGAEHVSFAPIVAAAEHTAFVHATPSERRVEKGRFVMLDFGCIYEGYCSDMTRTVGVGPLDERHREVYESVHRAQAAGLRAVKAGTTCGDVDKAARGVLAQAGLEEAFPHGLGHGVGLQIHEEPNLKKDVEDKLEAAMVVTIEPGVYLENWGGVRIEDLVLVADGAPEVLSTSPKELIEL